MNKKSYEISQQKCRENQILTIQLSISKILTAAKSNTRSLFRMITSNKSVKEKIPIVVTFKNEKLLTVSDINAALHQLFTTNMNNGDEIVTRDELQGIFAENISNEFDERWEGYIHQVTIDEVRMEVAKLDINKGPGMSKLTVDILK